MKKKSLLETNPYLKDPELRDALIRISVASSSAIEGVNIKIPKLSKKVLKKMRDIAAAQEAKKNSG
jgi:Fic family protein